MEAVILSGGFGTRLRPITYSRAKSLIPILNKPMIIYLIEKLPKEVDKVVLAVNYKKDQIEKYFDENDCGKEIVINNETKPLGTGGAAKFAERYITGNFLVLNSDIISSLDICDMIKFHKKKKAMATISLWPVENVSEFGVANVNDDGKIVGFVEKPRPEDAPSEFINAGAYFLEPEVLDYIDTDRLISMEKEIFPIIIRDTGRFFGYKFRGYWMDIGRISSYIDVHKFLMKKNKINNYFGNNCEIKGVLQESSIGNNVHIGKNSLIESTIVYDNTTISENVRLSNCVIGENCKIGGCSDLKNSVVGDNEKIKFKTVIDNETVWTKKIPRGYPDKQIGNPIEI
jgi:mannose-1-phosphate guanylyltransferase